MNELDAFLKDFYSKYSPSDYSPEKVKYIRENYGNDIDALVIDLYDKYADGGGKEKLDYIKSNYNLTGSMLSNNQKNLLDTVADKEAKDYNVIVGGGTFDDYSQHPNVVGMVTAFGPSTAAGKYQITKSTWDKVSEKLGLKDFSPESQDQAALYLAQERFKGKTGKDLDAALESDNPNDIEEIRNVLGGSGSDTLWQGLQGDKDFTRRYNERRGLVDAQGSASNPIGPIGVIFDEGVDQSKFDQETLTNMYIQAGGDPSKEKFTTKISKLGNTSGYNLQFQDSKGTKNYNYLPDNASVIDKFSSGITNGILKFGHGVSSTIGAVVGLVEDATELVTKGDTNLDKTFDYADNSVMDYLNGIKVYGEETQGYKNVEERARIAAQNQDAIGQIFAQISKLGYSEWWQNSGADMAGSMASFILPGMAVGKLAKGSTIFSRALQSGGVSKGFAENAVGYLVGDSIMSASEAAMEAGTVFKDVKQNLLDKGLSEDEATKQAADAASENWGTNYAGLMATNAIQMGGILGKLSTSTNMAKRVAVGIGAPILSEGFEEAFQTSAQKYSTDKGSNEPYNEGKNTGAFTTMFNPDGALGGTLEGVYKGLMNGDSETWESFIGGAVMGGGSSIIGTSKSVIDYYKTEKPVMSKVNNSLILSPNDIYKTDENNKIIYNKETGKPDIDPTKHLSNIQGVNSILNIDALTQEADNNPEAIKFLHSAKIASIVHDHMSSKNPNIEALDNAINNSMTKKEYEKNKLSNFYSYEEFKDIRKNILEISKDNYNNIYSSPQFKNQSKEFKQGLYHNTVQQDLVGKELDKYTNQLEQLNSKEEKLNSLQKEQKRNLETKIASLNTYKLELEKAFDKHTNNKAKDAKETKAEEIKTEAAEAAKQGVPVEEILANKTGEEFKAAKEGVIEANTQAIIDELDTYNSPKQYEIAIKNNPEHAKLINDHFNTKLAKQTKAPLTNVNQIPTRYGQENNFLQEHEQQKVGQELNNLLNEKENLGEEVANYEQLRTDPNFKFIPDPELVHLGQHILNGGSVATYTQTFNQDNLQDPLLQKAIDKTNNIKEVPVKKESSLPEVINEKETKETEAPFTALEVFVPMSGLPESRGKNKTVYVTIFDSNGNEVETKVSRFVPKDIWNTSQSSKLEKLNEYFNLSEGYSYKETVIPENEEFNKGTHVASTILKEGDIVYYEVTPNDWNNTATKDNFIISVVSYIKNGKVVKRDTIDAERIVVSQVPSNTNSFIKDNTHKLEIKKIRELAWEKFNNNRSSTFQIAEVKVKNLNRTTAYHKGSWRNITKKEIKNFIFDVVIQKWENNEVGFSSSIKDPALFNSGNSLVGTGNMKIEPQDVGKVIMFVPNTNSVTNEISNIPVKLNTKKLSEVPIFKQKFTDALNDIMKLSTFDERLEATNKMWYNLIGSKVGSISRKRTEDSTFDTDSKDGLVNPRGGIGNIIYYQESKFDPTKKGFFTVINGEEFSYLSVEDLVNKLGETRVHIPHDLVKLTLERFPELVQTDLIEPQERGIESEMPNIFMGTNIMVESLPERIDIVKQEQEQVKQEQEKEQENGIIEEDENIIPVFKISNKSYTGTGAKEYIKERFTEIGVDISDASLDILRELYEVGDKKIWGAFHKAVVHLASDAGLKVGKHEAMHVLFNLFLNPKQKEQIYKELFKNFGKELGISKEEFEKELNKPINQINKFKVEDNNQVNYILKVIDILQSDKAKQIFVKGRKNLWSLDKILTELNIPKEQKELVKQIEQDFVQKQFAIYDESLQYALELADKYSYTVEINTAKEQKYHSKFSTDYIDFILDNDKYEFNDFGILSFTKNGKEIGEKKYSEAMNEYNKTLNKPTQHYSNLTVPGGTNYTEQEISTPLITPSIKGHAQFATDNGIGWFRSDERKQGFKSDKKGLIILVHYSSKNTNPLDNFQEDYPLYTSKGESSEYEYYGKKYNFLIKENATIKNILDFHGKYGIDLDQHDMRSNGMQPYHFSLQEIQAIKKEGVDILIDDWGEYIVLNPNSVINKEEVTDTKTRRILEVQSDLFQKGRDKETLAETEGDRLNIIDILKPLEKELIDYINSEELYYYGTNKSIISATYEKTFDGERIDVKLQGEKGINSKTLWLNRRDEEGFKYVLPQNIIDKINIPKVKNQFLQLLNKDNNWVTFFVKSIIQDSAKQGYEKVLFPSGNTASKVEGHTTLEEFKKQKEDRIKELEKQTYSNFKSFNIEATHYMTKDNKFYKQDTTKDLSKIEITEKEYKEAEKERIKEKLDNSQKEIEQLKQELERVETEGFGALKPIYNFYENTVTNILKKNYTVNKITDEYGNTWNEIAIIPELVTNNIKLKTEENSFYQKQSILIRLEEKLANAFEDYKYTGVLSDNFKKNYPEISKFLEKIFKFLLDQYHMLKGYLTDSLTINDIFYQLDNNIFGKGYDGKRRKSYQETFSRNLLEIYGEEAKFKLKGVDTINLRKYSKFIVTNIFTNLLPPVKDKSGVPRKVSWLTDVLKDNKDASSLINDLFKKLPAEINRRITNAKTDEIKKSMEEIKSILNEDRFKWEILAQVKEITGYGFTPIEENNNEDVDDDTSDEISDPTGEYSESNIVKKDNQQDPKNNIKGKLRELLNKIVKYDLKNNLPLIDPTTGGFVYYEFNEVSNRLYHYLPDSLNEKDMWNRILELSESFEDIWFIRNQIETASKQRNQDIYDTDLFNKLWLKFGGQRKINYSFAINNNDGTVNVKNSTKHRVHDNILTEVRNYIELQNRKVDAPEVNIDNLFQLFNVYGLYISKADIAKLNEKEIVKAINAFTNFEKYISNGGNPFTFELNKTPEIVSANNLVELVVKYSPNLADNVIYTIHGKKEFIVQMNNFLTKTLNQFKNNNKEFRNKFKNTILHSKLPIYDLTETDISKWEIHYNNGFIQQGKKKGTEYSKFTLKELISQNINFAFSDVNSKTMKVMLPIFSDATSHAYINVNKLTPDIIIMQMAKTAIAELERIKFSLNNKTGYENFDKNGKHFLLLPFLEKHKEKLLEFNINDPLLSSHLESLIEPVIKKQFADYTNKLIKLGVLDKIVTVNEAKVKLEKIVAGTGVTSRINESDALDRVREYFYNQYYYNTQFIPLFAGDPAFYKPNKKNKNDTNPEMSVSIDFLKRFKEVHSPTTHGLYKDINGKPKSTKNLLYLYDIYKPSTDEFIDGIAYLNDIPSNIVDTYKKEVRNIYSETKEELTEEEKDLKKKYPNDFSYLHNFSQNNLTDAQKLNNPEFTLMVMEAHDKISPEQRKILREQINNNLATDVTLEVLKPFVFSHEFISLNESSNLLRPFQEKNSEFTLLPNVAYLTKDKTFEIPTKDINWDNYVFPTKAKLLWIMQGKGNPENAIDGISFESATKVDKDTRNLLSIDDVLNMDNDLTSNVVTSSMEGYGLSNEVPADKQIDKNIDLGSQIKVLITEGLKESLTINGITYNPESLLNEFQDLHIKGHREQFKKLKDKTSTAEKTIAILKEAAIKLGKSVSTIMGYNKNVDGKPDIPLELDATSNQHMLNSLTKKTVSESGPGGTFVNVSSVSIDDLAIKWKKDKAGKVIGIDHIECAAAINSPYIDALVDKNGIVTVEDVQAAYGEEVTDKLLSMVAYRIPTEDKYSMYPLKIKYILPRSSGAALMLPKEATSITGLDFDVDKMFFIKYAFEIESNFSKYLGHVNDIIGNSSVQDGETISNGLVDPETGNPYVLTTNKFKELFNKALNEDVGLTIEEDAIIEHFKDNMNEYKELLDTKNIKVIPSSYDTSSSRHNFKLDIMLAIAQTTSFARSFTHPGSSSILAREVELFSSPKYSNYDIIEDESTAQVTLPDVQDENAKKANIGGASIGIFANANKHHAIIEYAQLELKKIFNFSNKQYDSIGKRKSEDGKFIKDITASLLFASTEHIKTPLMDKLNIDLDNVNALLAGIRLGIPFHDLMVLINQPVIKDTLKKFPNSTKLVPELNNELSILALQNQIDLNSVQKSDITIAELETMFNPKGLSNKVITRENLIALNKFIELATIGEELFQIQINTKFDTSNQFGPELLDNQFKLQRLEYLYDKLSINSVFKNFDDIVPRVTYNKANQEWTLAPSKLRLNDSYIQIMVDQLNHFKNNFSFLSDSFIKLQYLIKDLSNQDHFYPYQIKKINGEIYNAVAQGTLNNIADIITNIPTEWATIRYKTKEQYMPFLNALTREIVFGKPVLRLYDNVIVGNALSDKYKDIFEDMLADPDTKVFAERLAVYAYFTSGFKFTPRGFSRFVPNTFLLENEQGKKIRDLYNNFDINKSNLNSDEIAELIIYNNPSLVTSINIKEHVDNVVIKPTSHGQLPSSFIIKEDNESLYVDKFGNPNRFLSYTVYIAVGGESVPLEMLFESTGNIRGYYSAVNLPGNSKIFSNYTGVDLGFYPDIAPTTIELNSNEISEEIQTMPVKDLDTTISYYEGNITPEPNTIFVFGSNPEGRHGKGAALTAVQQFGAKYGQGEGLQGNAYALPTKDLRVKENNGFKSISPKQITESIVKLYKVAKQNPNKEFKIAYKNTTEKSLNGYTGLEMIDMFNNAGRIPLNIVFSKEWIDTDKLKQPQNISVKDINNLPDIDIDIKNEKCK